MNFSISNTVVSIFFNFLSDVVAKSSLPPQVKTSVSNFLESKILIFTTANVVGFKYFLNGFIKISASNIYLYRVEIDEDKLNDFLKILQNNIGLFIGYVNLASFYGLTAYTMFIGLTSMLSSFEFQRESFAKQLSNLLREKTEELNLISNSETKDNS